jgi:hypothetical protein
MYQFLLNNQEEVVHFSRLIVGCSVVVVPMLFLYWFSTIDMKEDQ